MRTRGKRELKRTFPVRQALIALFLGVIVFSLYQLWHINKIYAQEARLRLEMEPFRPETGGTPLAGEGDVQDAIINPTIIRLQEENEDVVGWVRLDGTGVDYPFVQGEDNDYYLHRDIHGDYLFAGTAFLDHLSDPTFSSFSAVIFGHNMKNGTMFSDIGRYANAGFFNENQTGWLFLPDATYQLDIFAFLSVQYNDEMVYQTEFTTDGEKQAFLDYIVQYAQRSRDLSLTTKDQFLVLSTCTGDVKTMRNVLVTRLMRIS